MERSALHSKLKSLGGDIQSKSGARVAHVDEEPATEAEEYVVSCRLIP